MNDFEFVCNAQVKLLVDWFEEKYGSFDDYGFLYEYFNALVKKNVEGGEDVKLNDYL